MELLSNVIGTACLLVFMLLMSSSISSLQQMETFDLVKRQLKETTDRASSQTMSLIVMANSSDAKSLFFYQSIEIPASVANYGYSLSLSMTGGIYNIMAKLDRYNTINVVSSLPFNGTSLGISFDTRDSIQVGPGVLTASYLPSGSTNGVIWCKKVNGAISLGFGRLKS